MLSSMQYSSQDKNFCQSKKVAKLVKISTYTVHVYKLCLSLQVESPPQQADASVNALYSLVVSVGSSGDIHEVYIDTHFHYTALKVK